MKKNKVTICCWNKSHINKLEMTKKQEEKLARDIPKGRAVCPTCRDDGDGNQPIIIMYGSSVFQECKFYKCENGHATAIMPFTNGMLNIHFGMLNDQFENVRGSLSDLDKMIDTDEIVCHHCNGSLSPLDDLILHYPSVAGIKTRTRVGDLWDKAGVEPVRNGTYTKDGDYNESKTQKANMARLKNMNRRRNIPKNRGPQTK